MATKKVRCGQVVLKLMACNIDNNWPNSFVLAAIAFIVTLQRGLNMPQGKVWYGLQSALYFYVTDPWKQEAIMNSCHDTDWNAVMDDGLSIVVRSALQYIWQNNKYRTNVKGMFPIKMFHEPMISCVSESELADCWLNTNFEQIQTKAWCGQKVFWYKIWELWMAQFVRFWESAKKAFVIYLWVDLQG